MARVKAFEIPEELDKQSKEILKVVQENAHKYEEAFLSSFMSYIKEDELLRNFYIRLVYECEVVQIVIEKRNDFDLMELKEIVDEMQSASSIESVAICDSHFHRRLFAIAKEEEFFEWYKLQSKNLTNFLNSFWSYIGYKTDYYKRLLDIHMNIYLAIEKKDVKMALSAMQDHFSILLLELLGATFQKG